MELESENEIHDDSWKANLIKELLEIGKAPVSLYHTVYK